MGNINITPYVIFNGKKYNGTCVICKHSVMHEDEDRVVCSADIDLRKVDLLNGKPDWCPLNKKSELDYIKSC